MKAFEHYLKKWHLIPDGSPIITNTSQLLPVICKATKSMLKIASSEEEQRGASLMIWWDGEGAARVFKHEATAILMERAICNRSLANMSQSGLDDEATKIICAVIAKLHAKNKKPFPSTLVSLSTWFRALHIAATQQGGIFAEASLQAIELLNNPQEIVVLHGDIHHQNILDAGSHGWIAIDPKGLLGARAFEYANIFCNPDKQVAMRPGRFAHQATIIAEIAGLERARLIKWIFAYAGLSAAWSLQDGESPDLALAIANLSKAEIFK